MLTIPLRFISMFLLMTSSIAVSFAQNASTDTSTPDTQQLENVSVLFATVRNRNGHDPKQEYFGGQRGRGRTGVCKMEYKPIWGMDMIADSLPFHVPEERIRLASVEEFPINQFWDEISAANGRNDGNIVLYVHGYNIGFEKSCTRASIFQRNLDIHDRLILFSWPADGNVMNYTLDEADLTWSVHYIEKLLSELIRRYGAGRIDVVGHSLGGRGVVNAISRMSRNSPDPLINELVLVAPDMDAQVFGQLLPEIKPLVRRITLYASENDHALRASQEVHGYPRLGQGGTMLSVYPGVETIDVTDLGQRVASGHLYHLFNPTVSSDIMRLLNKGESASQRPGLNTDDKNGFVFWRMVPPS